MIVSKKKKKKKVTKVHKVAEFGTVEVSNLLSSSEWQFIFGKCEVTCLENGHRLWIVPGQKPAGPGYLVFKTAYIGDRPKEIGFVPTALEARAYLHKNHGVRLDSWKKCPLISMFNSDGAMA